MNKSYTFVTGVLISMFFPMEAFAYLDPGTGSLLLQGVIAGAAAIGIAIKLYWNRILRFLGIRKHTPSKIDADGLEKTPANGEEK